MGDVAVLVDGGPFPATPVIDRDGAGVITGIVGGVVRVDGFNQLTRLKSAEIVLTFNRTNRLSVCVRQSLQISHRNLS